MTNDSSHDKVDKEALEKAIQTAFYGLNITRDSVVKIIEAYESAKRPVGGEVDEAYSAVGQLICHWATTHGLVNEISKEAIFDLLEAIRPYLRDAKE